LAFLDEKRTAAYYYCVGNDSGGESVNDTSGSSDTIKVVDRRRFTEDGDVRPGRETEAQAGAGGGAELPPQELHDEETSTAPDEASRTAAHNTSSQGFLELIASLAQQGELLISGGEGFPPQPEQARRIIDYLGVLGSKTRGNLSSEEERILSHLVYQLRTLYLQASQ
jgi:hypothetical protein